MIWTRALGALAGFVVVAALTGCGEAGGGAVGGADEEMYFTDAQLEVLSDPYSRYGDSIPVMTDDGGSRPVCDVIWDLTRASGVPPDQQPPEVLRDVLATRGVVGLNMRTWSGNDIGIIRMVPACTDQILERATAD